ncbi:AAA family ATPase [Puia sp. P3]|uniref:AAA family ATPase n=1 Tax=Puia sp. P3 TaxID=3423952 RepID=UPI003D674453
MNNLYDQTTFDTNSLFDGHYLDAKALYMQAFGVIPNIICVTNIDGEKVFRAVRENFPEAITRVFQYRYYNRQKKEYTFDSTLILFNNGCLVELDNSWCDIYHDGCQQGFIDVLTGLITPFKERQRRKPLEINLVISQKGGLQLKSMEIRRTRLDLDLFYNEDFKETHEVIQHRLSKEKDKGIVLLHGLPGTGKTTYLRYLIGKIKKRIMFLSPSAAGDLLDPSFIEVLVKNRNTLLVIEDAENIIMDRRHSSGSSVSNLLNISDGLLADCLNVQLVCTFNSPLTMVDTALLRKGRLIARYDFGKLSVARAQRLSDHLGFVTKIVRPMTVAEVANQNEKEFEIPEARTIGFRN